MTKEKRRPRRPIHLPDHAEECLQALVSEGLAETISLGGALGLLHYLDYRPTHDVDAWWSDTTTAEDRQRVVKVIETALAPFGSVETRRWGDVVSVELETHLSRIARHRPLDQITDSQQRAEAEQTRQWFKEALLRILWSDEEERLD